MALLSNSPYFGRRNSSMRRGMPKGHTGSVSSWLSVSGLTELSQGLQSRLTARTMVE